MTVDSATLGTSMLGKPARAIVLRDTGVYKRKDRAEKYEPEAAQETVDLEAMLEKQEIDPTAEDVIANIESLKPVDERQLSERDFRKLQDTLIAGFTAPQLQAYLQWHVSKPLPKSSSERMASRLAWIKSMTPWTPLGAGSDSLLPEDAPLHGYMPATASPKERTAIRILHEVWGLTINELAMVLGEVRVKVRAAEFVLLQRGTQRFMNDLGKLWLGPGERIESIRNANTLRFIVHKPKADIIIDQLNKTLKTIESKALPLSLFTATPLEEGVIEELGRITNTHIRYNETGRRLQVTWLEVRRKGKEDLNPALEDLRHVVFRLLLTAMAPPRVTASLISDLPPDTTLSLVPDRVNMFKWGWLNRLSSWERAVIPSMVGESMQQQSQALPLPFGKEDVVIDATPMRDTTQLRNNSGQGKDGYPVQPVHWAKSVRNSTIAHYGHVLHAQQSSEPAEASATSITKLSAATHPRIFSPVIPHPTRLAELEARAQGYHEAKADMYASHSTILIRLQPSPMVGSSKTSDEYGVPKDKNQPVLDDEGVSLEGPKLRKHKEIAQKKVARKEKKRNPDVKLESSQQEPWRMAKPSPAPMLELRLAIEDTQIVGVQSLRAIKHKAVSDVMLPASMVDIRFSQTQYVELEGTKEDMAAWQPLKGFLGNARIELSQGKVDMASRQKFPIPHWLYSNFDAKKNDPDTIVGTQYEFVGLELHRAVSMPYEGLTMTYTSIEAGQGGGRRAELSLEAQAGVSSSSPTVAEEPAAVADEESTTNSETVFETELDIDPAKKASKPTDDGVESAPPPNEPTKEDFVKTCYALARDKSFWAGYDGRSKE